MTELNIYKKWSGELLLSRQKSVHLFTPNPSQKSMQNIGHPEIVYMASLPQVYNTPEVFFYYFRVIFYQIFVFHFEYHQFDKSRAKQFSA